MIASYKPIYSPQSPRSLRRLLPQLPYSCFNMRRFYTGAKSCCWMRSLPRPQQLGQWYENEPGRRLTPRPNWPSRGRYPFDNETSSEGSTILTLPNLYAVRSSGRGRIGKRAVKRKATRSKRRRQPGQHQRRPEDVSSISGLPTELLVSILQHLVPTGRVFHFSPTSRMRGGVLSVSVHTLCGFDNWKPGCDISTLALTCQRFRDISYGLLYGQNQFVIELATTAITSEIQLADDVETFVESEDIEHQLSWSRICSKGSISAFYPSTPFTLRYVTDLTICINLTAANSSGGERFELCEQLQSIITCFGDDAPSLRRLAVSLDVCEHQHRLFRSKRLELCGSPPRMGFREQTPTTQLANVTSRHYVLLEKLVQPLFQLRGVGSVVVRGLLDEDFAATLRDSVTRTPETIDAEKDSLVKRACRAWK